VTAALQRPAGGPRRFVRIHSLATGRATIAADLHAAFRPGLEGLVLPKVEHPDDVREVAELLSKQEAAAGLPDGSVRLVALIESARGLLQAPAICAGSSRLIALMFGAEDFMRDLGMLTVRPQEADDWLYARSAVVVAAAGARLAAIDRVYLDVHDPEGLRRDALQARRLGFAGKALIHPAQIDVVAEVFRPTPEEVAYARRVVAGFDAAEAAGAGATLVDGRMVDRPVVERARQLLESLE
jgi:citrate lyase beta subunit